MTSQNYLMINESTNIVENVCVWDGDIHTWQPPAGYLMLIEAITPAMIWEPIYNEDKKIIDYKLVEQVGVGQIGFTWNGAVLTTNEPKPPLPTPPVPTA